MIEFCPVTQLRPMGKSIELARFNEVTLDLNSVEKFMAGILYRFALDADCPAMFIKVPKQGDEPIDGMVFVEDFPILTIQRLAKRMFNEANEWFGTDEVSVYNLGSLVLLVKKDFEGGNWSGYDYECAAVDGKSIIRKRGART